MTFTEDEAKAKVGKRVRLRDDSFSSDGVAKGTIGRVVDAKLLGKVGVGTGQVSTTGKEEEIWVVYAQFDVPHGQPEILIGKDEYERSLEEI